MNKITVFLIFILFFMLSCAKEQSSTDIIYQNDFESSVGSNIVGAVISQYNGSKVLGQFSNSGFTLKLDNVPAHKVIKISFDLFIHDSWDGNLGVPVGPDLWQMFIDGKTYINTTFSNIACPPGYFCSPQAYPDNFPNNNHNPKAGALKTDLPGICQTGNGTSLYHIEKTITHNINNLSLQCVDKLVQGNSSNSKCDGSWSVDNLKITAADL